MKKVTIIGLMVAMLAIFTGSASAQDGPVMTTDPASVDAAGEHTLTVMGENFTPGNSIFILPCEGVDGDLELLAESDAAAVCDVANLTPAVIGDDGTFSAEVTYNIPEGGLAIAGGDAGGTDAGAVLVTVGGGDAAAEEEPAEDATEEAAPAEESGDLAQTGVETPLMVGLGTALLGAGFIATRAGRRLGDR